MEFAWLPEKEQDNIAKHGINFTDASQIFRDPRRIERHDDDSSIDYEYSEIYPRGWQRANP